jgi:hypothetical protein
MPRPWAILGGAIFFSLPYVFIYAHVMMSETVGLFLFALYIFILSKHVQHKSFAHPALLVFIAALMTLTKFVFSFVFVASTAYWIVISIVHNKKEKRFVAFHLWAVVGIVCILFWMSFVHHYHGVWALSIHSGRHLYGVVFKGKLFPPNSDPSMKKFLSRFPSKEAMLQPAYLAQFNFASDFYQDRLTEYQIDQLFGALSIAAIKYNPVGFGSYIVRMITANATGLPYDQKIVQHLGFVDPACPTCLVGYCHFSWNPSLCAPPLRSDFFDQLWGRYFLLERSIYPYVQLFLFALACFGIITSFFSPIFFRIIAVLFMMIYGVHTLIESDGRYLLLNYPAYSILITLGVKQIIQLLFIKRRT